MDEELDYFFKGDEEDSYIANTKVHKNWKEKFFVEMDNSVKKYEEINKNTKVTIVTQNKEKRKNGQ